MLMKKIMTLLLVALLWAACGGSKTTSDNVAPVALLENGVEVLSFHNKQRCPTCIAIENETRNVLNSSFAQEMADSTIVLRVFDLSEKENQQIAEHYQVSFSSLILVKYVNGQPEVHNLTEYAFSKARVAPEEFKEELVERMEGLLR